MDMRLTLRGEAGPETLRVLALLIESNTAIATELRELRNTVSRIGWNQQVELDRLRAQPVVTMREPALPDLPPGSAGVPGASAAQDVAEPLAAPSAAPPVKPNRLLSEELRQDAASPPPDAPAPEPDVQPLPTFEPPPVRGARKPGKPAGEWTPEQTALADRLYHDGVRMQDIREQVNALPGPHFDLSGFFSRCKAEFGQRRTMPPGARGQYKPAAAPAAAATVASPPPPSAPPAPVGAPIVASLGQIDSWARARGIQVFGPGDVPKANAKRTALGLPPFELKKPERARAAA